MGRDLKDSRQAAVSRRPPPKRVRCLLPIWGSKYVREFLSLRLPTWLAPGNIPALADTLATEFVFLTTEDDATFLTSHPGYRRLSRICPTVVDHIDDMVTGHNHTATVTLAYERGIRAAGEEIVDTCFLFLVSDYVAANGAFGNVLTRMIDGASAVQAGNFQLEEQRTLPWLEDQIRRSPDVLSLSARELVSWGLGGLHPATLANTINFGIFHNSNPNRLFWRIDATTMIGRFYLMHMIGIRPEVSEFTIGASCDYSFVPELCPSGNVAIITDSDDYLVLEMQPRAHEAQYLRPGPLTHRQLGHSLNEWTTERHRKNVAATIVYHAGGIPSSLPDAISEMDRFVETAGRYLRWPAQPHRGHPYWAGSFAAFREATGLCMSWEEWSVAFGLPHPERTDNPLLRTLLRSVPYLFFRKAPHLRLWHPRQGDYEPAASRVEALRGPGSRMLFLSDAPSIFSVVYADDRHLVHRSRLVEFLRRTSRSLRPLQGVYDICVMEVAEEQIKVADILLDRAAPLMKDGGRILFLALNRRRFGDRCAFKDLVTHYADYFNRSYQKSARYSFVPTSAMGWLCTSTSERLVRAILRRRIWPTLLAPVLLPLLALGNVVVNLATRPRAQLPAHGLLRSFIIEIEVDAEFARKSAGFSRRYRVLSRVPDILDDVGRAGELLPLSTEEGIPS